MILAFVRIRNTDQANIKAPLREKLARMDTIGTILLVASVVCLLIALQWGGITYPWKSSKVIGLFIGAGLLFTVFVGLQWRLGERATIPLRILRQRSVIMGAWFLFFLSVPVYVVRLQVGIYTLGPCY